MPAINVVGERSVSALRLLKKYLHTILLSSVVYKNEQSKTESSNGFAHPQGFNTGSESVSQLEHRLA